MKAHESGSRDRQSIRAAAGYAHQDRRQARRVPLLRLRALAAACLALLISIFIIILAGSGGQLLLADDVAAGRAAVEPA